MNSADNVVRYVGNFYNGFGERGGTENVTEALLVTTDLPLGSISGAQRQVKTQNSLAQVDLKHFSYVVGFASTGNDLSAGSYK